MVNYETKEIKHIVLLGASVGKGWNIVDLPKRIGNFNYSFEFVCEYSFDKSNKILEILARVKDRPDAIIIKECAAYFPGDLQGYQHFITEWVNLCRKEKIIPILATVVPVVRTFPVRMFLKYLLQKKFKLRVNTFAGIIAFNDWLKEFADKEDILILDLESALRISSTDRHLDCKLATNDGLHLNEKGYRKLDKIVIPTLSKIRWAK